MSEFLLTKEAEDLAEQLAAAHRRIELLEDDARRTIPATINAVAAAVNAERRACAAQVRSYSIRFVLNGVDTGFSSGGLGELADALLKRGGP